MLFLHGFGASLETSEDAPGTSTLIPRRHESTPCSAPVGGPCRIGGVGTHCIRLRILTSFVLGFPFAWCLPGLGVASETVQFGTPADDDVNTMTLIGAAVFIGGTTKGDLVPEAAQGDFDCYVRRACDACQVATGDSCDTTYTQFGSPAEDVLMSITAGPDGEVYAAGRTRDVLGLPFVEELPGPGFTEAFGRRYDIGSDGELVPGWGWEVRTPEHDEMLAVAARESVVYVAGATGGDLVTGDGVSFGEEDAFVRAYHRPSGALLGTLQFGTGGSTRSSPWCQPLPGHWSRVRRHRTGSPHIAGCSLPGGPHRISWNERSGGGEPVPAGVYFARVVSGAARGSAKVVAVR
jgi:hypothetical protein